MDTFCIYCVLDFKIEPKWKSCYYLHTLSCFLFFFKMDRDVEYRIYYFAYNKVDSLLRWGCTGDNFFKFFCIFILLIL